MRATAHWPSLPLSFVDAFEVDCCHQRRGLLPVAAQPNCKKNLKKDWELDMRATTHWSGLPVCFAKK